MGRLAVQGHLQVVASAWHDVLAELGAGAARAAKLYPGGQQRATAGCGEARAAGIAAELRTECRRLLRGRGLLEAEALVVLGRHLRAILIDDEVAMLFAELVGR